jgi:AcrR family transcriptional regulator
VAPGTSPQRQSTYSSPLRARQAAETRRTVLNAATRLFTERGWAGTTLAAVATGAGTAVETVYAAFGSKSGLLIAAINAAIAGDASEEPLVQRPEFARLGVGERTERLALAARIITGALERAVPLMRALREAAASDPAARARLDAYETDRRAVIAAGLQLVRGKKPPETLVDSMWALASPEVFVKLTGERGWPVARYQRWLIDTASVLLHDVDGRPGRTRRVDR